MSDPWTNQYGGRIEVFNIAYDEILIGCELNEEEGMAILNIKHSVCGVTWVKMKNLKTKD